MRASERLARLDWSAELACVVGLLTTDGNLSPDGRHIAFVSKDIEQVECLRDLLSLNNRITRKASGFNPDGVYWLLQFGSVAFYRWLLEIGLTPRKSKTLGRLDVPDEFFFDFLRGHLDGDGMIRAYQDPVYPNSRRLYVVFHSASRPHLEWIQDVTGRLIGVTGYVETGVRIFRLTYAKTESLVLLPSMYHHSDIPCLKRKRDLVQWCL
jgi:hypothetical protein